jgi:hypothetical protein
VGFPGGNGVGGSEVEVGEGGRGGVDRVDKVPDGGGADAAKGGDDPREEEAAARGGARGVFGGFFGGAGGDDGVGVKGGGSGIGREERATDGEVDGGGVSALDFRFHSCIHSKAKPSSSRCLRCSCSSPSRSPFLWVRRRVRHCCLVAALPRSHRPSRLL